MFDKPHESPYQTQQFQSLEYSKQNVVKQVELVFTYYCGKGSKYNYQELQEKYFMQMATELFSIAGQENEFGRRSQKWVRVATLYYTKGRSKPLYFMQFLELLPGLARCIFIDQNSSPLKSQQAELEEERAMKNLLLLFEKLHHHILDEEIYRRGIRSEEIEEETKQFLIKLKDSLAKLYKIYFQWELTIKQREKDSQKSFDGLLEIMKDFEVYPKLISASQLYFIFKEITSDREHNHLTLLSPSMYTKSGFIKLGEYFTLTRFAESLILISHICVGKLKRIEGQEMVFSSLGMTQKEGVKLLLQYMETMRSVKEKYCKFTKERFSLIVYEEYSEYVSKREEALKSSPTKSQVNSLGESKKSFYGILSKIDL